MSEKQINIRFLLLKALKYWYVFLISLVLALSAAYFYLQIAPPKYKASSMILIKDDDKSGQPIEETIFRELGIGTKKKSLQNETYIIKSTPLMEQVVKNLDLQYDYYKISGLKRRNIYKKSPIKIVNWQPNEPKTFAKAKVHFGQRGTYTLEFDEDATNDLDGKNNFRGEFGKELTLPIGKLTLARTDWEKPSGEIEFEIAPVHAAALDLVDRIDVQTEGKESSTLQLSIKDEVAKRAEEILTELMNKYNEESVADKNKAYENSLKLLNERIDMITNELASVESNVESYKRQNNMVELSSEGTMLMNEMADYNKTISNIDIQLEILKGIEDFLEKNRYNFEFVPTNSTLTNLTLTAQLASFNELLKQRAENKAKYGPSHPDLILIEKQIQNMRGSIIENIQSIKADLQITRNSNINMQGTLENRMQSLPRHERELIDIERRKGVKENLYLYLLQKREESALSMAVTVPTGRIIEPAEAGDPVSPVKMQIWLIALFLGLALPVGFVVLMNSMNNKVQLEDDIQEMTNVPVVGMLAHSRKNGSLAITEKSRSVEAEMFRLLRANLAYISPGKAVKTMLITSSISGEGKSYIALNLAVTQALTGKKVLLLELDLRKPKQEQYMKSKRGHKGVVDFLVDSSVKVNQIIQKSEMHPNLDIITCGPQPPNPSELILSERLRFLLNDLETKYDFIILDAPPVGLVADALQMKDIAEATMYVVRAGVTRKGYLNIIKEIAQKDKLPKPFVVLNDVNVSDFTGYGYSNGYGYTYAYSSNNGYYEKEA